MDRRLLLLVPVIIAGLLIALFFYPTVVGEDRSLESPPLGGIEWSLQSFVLEGQTVSLIDCTSINIHFDEGAGTSSGSGGCNSFSSEYEIIVDSEISESINGIEVLIEIDGSISLNGFVNTEIGCMEPGVMELEEEIFEFLREADRFELSPESLKLVSSSTQNERPSFLSFVKE